MKPRIEKKLSRRLKEIAPLLFSDARLATDVERFPKHYAWEGELTPKKKRQNYQQKVSVNNIWSIGGGRDYWGEVEDDYTLWQYFSDIHGDWPEYYECDGRRYMTQWHRSTTRQLLKLAADLEAKEWNSFRGRALRGE